MCRQVRGGAAAHAAALPCEGVAAGFERGMHGARRGGGCFWPTWLSLEAVFDWNWGAAGTVSLAAPRSSYQLESSTPPGSRRYALEGLPLAPVLSITCVRWRSPSCRATLQRRSLQAGHKALGCGAVLQTCICSLGSPLG